MAHTIQLNTKPSAEIHQAHWQRIILLVALAYEGLGCLLGGTLLIIAPDGRLMDMPVDLMHGAFPDFMVPGIILFALGILNTSAFVAVLRKASVGWILAAMAMGGLLIWFWVEIAILLELHWLHAMWGLPVVLGSIMAISLTPVKVRQQCLLISGILASVLYAAINIIVALQWPAYDSATQTVSELSAVDAPTRMLWIVLCTPYTLLMMAFSWGVVKAAHSNRRLRITGALLLAYSALGIFWPFAPMHLREALATGGSTFSDTMHLTLGAITEVIYFIALGFAAAALGKQFRIYSITTLAVLCVFGALTFIDAPNVSKNLPTPFIGIWERINIGVFLLWVIVLAVILLRKKHLAEEAQHVL
ncbi:MAG: DUF998 domain-containing protein [Bacteroidetes bacterium]|nr:DUF998 domain-containing protein [Bacteroidota bacterium]